MVEPLEHGCHQRADRGGVVDESDLHQCRFMALGQLVGSGARSLLVAKINLLRDKIAFPPPSIFSTCTLHFFACFNLVPDRIQLL